MAQNVRRRMASIQLSFAAGALGLLAGIGLGKGTEPPPHVDAELAAKRNTITIFGSNIADGTVRYQDLNKASIQKGLYLKTQVDRLFLKLSDADARFHKVITNAVGGYIKLTDADTRFLKVGSLDGFVKLSDADARFIKYGALDSYVKLDALGAYVKLDAADGRFLKLDDVDARIDKHLTTNSYIKIGALGDYVKIDGLADYVKVGDLADYPKFGDLADYPKFGDLADYPKFDDLANYIKGEDAHAAFVEGDGSVVTGSQLVGGGAKPLLEVRGALAVSAQKEGAFAQLTLQNLTEGDLSYSSSVKDPGGGEQGGVIPKGGTKSILIGLLLPAVVQVVAQDSSSVHTFNFSAFSAGDELQVVGQALSGAPPGDR